MGNKSILQRHGLLQGADANFHALFSNLTQSLCAPTFWIEVWVLILHTLGEPPSLIGVLFDFRKDT